MSFVDAANAERHAVERLRRKEQRAWQQCRFEDHAALMRGRLALQRELRVTQRMLADMCAPWFEVRA